MIGRKYPRFNFPQTWEHVIKCRETKELKRAFMKELLIEMLKKKPRDADCIDVFNAIKDILKDSSKDKEGEHETTQEHIDLKYLFMTIVIKN